MANKNSTVVLSQLNYDLLACSKEELQENLNLIGWDAFYIHNDKDNELYILDGNSIELIENQKYVATLFNFLTKDDKKYKTSRIAFEELVIYIDLEIKELGIKRTRSFDSKGLILKDLIDYDFRKKIISENSIMLEIIKGTEHLFKRTKKPKEKVIQEDKTLENKILNIVNSMKDSKHKTNLLTAIDKINGIAIYLLEKNKEIIILEKESIELIDKDIGLYNFNIYCLQLEESEEQSYSKINVYGSMKEKILSLKETIFYNSNGKENSHGFNKDEEMKFGEIKENSLISDIMTEGHTFFNL